MIIRIDRKWKKPNYTISNVFINGQRFGDGKSYCNALEDTDRGLTSYMTVAQITKKKVYGKTAIPKGEYVVTITYSPKFRRNMPLVNNVKGFEGIRLHSLNKPEDSLGCIGFGKNDKVGWISNSRYWTGLVEEKIKTALGRGEPVKLVID
jgi:hypothetical protein